MTLRNERVRKELMREISDILRREIKDSRISGIVSIVDVEVSHDNSFAKVYYSVFGNDEENKKKTIEAIEQNTAKVRYEVGKRIRLRLTPELRFIYDDSIERGTKVTELINKISRGEIK
ncbi:30S ribosome-binding factor RbfA [bacterium]|nr:30S ribosome-binding factor RbfA [bacterium]